MTATAREYMTTEEVADLLRTTPSTLRYWRYQGKGPDSIKPGRKVLYSRRVVDAWRRSLEEGGGAEAGRGL